LRLLSTDITKSKRLSLDEVKLPAPDLRVKPTTPIQVERPPQAERPPKDEEIAYSKLVSINPYLETLVKDLDLVSITTGERIKKIELSQELKPHPEPEIKAQEIDKDKLIALAKKVIKGADSYTKEELIERIKNTTKVNQERAERGFNLILQAGAIEATPGDRYYLIGSTPF
jgi:hypothetical protein